MAKFKLKEELVQFLKRGLCPKEIAMTFAFAGTLGIFPLYGVTTFLMVAIAIRLRLNTPLLVSAGYLFTPLLFVFWVPFIRFGTWITDSQKIRLSWEELNLMLQNDWLILLEKFYTSILLGVLGWLVIAPIIFIGIYGIALALIKAYRSYLNHKSPKLTDLTKC